jgi:hypothetical protein
MRKQSVFEWPLLIARADFLVPVAGRSNGRDIQDIGRDA